MNCLIQQTNCRFACHLRATKICRKQCLSFSSKTLFQKTFVNQKGLTQFLVKCQQNKGDGIQDDGQKISEPGDIDEKQLEELFNQKRFLSNADKISVFDENKQLYQFPSSPGIYAVYDPEDTLQYIGLTRKINLSIGNHIDELPHLVSSVKFLVIEGGDRNALMEAWKAWLQESITTTGVIPPGNQAGQVKWQQRRPKPVKPDIRLTPGKGVEDLTCAVKDLIDMVVKNNKVVCFIKGTRTAPECGFSYKVLSILNELKINYETVNVLDDVHNPGLRESIKEYSAWPTIPQMYVDGEFVGGADIVETMHINGELQELFKKVDALQIK
eukprot:TRINITY_DN13988_c0_g4_i2.p1 TRINITY_DN13988_c0_g4~~TRINITY_DN13988_c0_g4_i2.p1  ORF type:complete len:327 (-),score=34.99 TRINITY_DN13988_c0_g4_i2:728-1708(-)